jgi:2-polyprenyl-3-methyl-5-hydroxy-6-metoxy-1,4-benzoquinol methylase
VNLTDLVRRVPVPEPWAEGDKIPWHDPDFSERMLQEHLSQAHDAASRRASVIDSHVAWIHRVVLAGRPGRILDLGCGPGLYTARLAVLGHECVGIDFAPAAIAYAREQARAASVPCAYHLSDVRSAEYGHGFDLVMLLYGEINVFRPAEARHILTQARQALAPGGRLLLEAHTDDTVRAMGLAPRAWRSAERGLFSAQPHLRLEEGFWNDEQRVTTTRYYIVDAAGGEVTAHAQSPACEMPLQP